jgi:hypothetical protein
MRPLPAVTPPGSTVFPLALLGALVIILPDAGVAGTGRLLASWMTEAPSLDGQITGAEWDQATQVDVGAGVTVRIGNDDGTLCLAVLDTLNPVYTAADALFLSYDDEGGTPPALDDGVWGNVGCQQATDLAEGVLVFPIDQTVLFQERAGAVSCASVPIPAGARFASAEQAPGVTYEIAIPLDGPAPLRQAVASDSASG